MTKQFDTFDTLDDRREIVILFERLGEGAANPNQVRAYFLRMMMLLSCNGFHEQVPAIDVSQCHPTGAYMTFVHLVGVLMIPMSNAVKILEECVSKKMWLSPHWKEIVGEKVDDLVIA